MKLFSTFEFEVKRGEDSCVFTAIEKAQNFDILETSSDETESSAIKKITEQYNKILDSITGVKGLLKEDGSEMSIEEFKELELPFGFLSAFVVSYYKKATSLYSSGSAEKKQ